jgi:hypothetical protein
MSLVEITLDARPTTNLALAHAGVPLVDNVRVRNRGTERLEGVTLVLQLVPDLGLPVRRTLPTLHPDEAVDLEAIELVVPTDRLRTVVEAERARLSCKLLLGDEVVAEAEHPVEVLAWNEWPGDRAPPALLAVFVTPNHPVVATVLRRVRDTLGASGDPSISGYQSRSPARALAQVRALYETLQSFGLTYVGVPASFEAIGQKVRLADVVLAEQLGNCLDVSLLFASCLEQMGLHPLIVRVQGHAFPGVWLVDERFPEGVVADAARLRTAVALNQLVFFDSSAAVAQPRLPFAEAVAVAARALADDASFRNALDLRVARTDRYRPLPTRETVAAPATAEGAEPPLAHQVLAEARSAAAEPEAAAPPPPPEPVVARFARWKEKLLDLSLRNKLLAFRADVKSALALDVPDLARFEDLLANEVPIQLVPRPPRDPRDERADAIVAHRVPPEQLREQRLADLESGSVHAPYAEAELVARAVGLERAARTDLEEGGANTLFLALGFLRWFESDASEVARVAPLLLVPVAVEFQRTSRRIRLRRLPEDAVANATLIEKVRRDFAVDLSAMGQLRADDAGVDVPELLRAARTAVARMPRWEILETAALGQFAFTKFLLWKDLEENAAVLLQNPVVQHIAAKSGRAYPNPVSATRPEGMDRTVPPEALPLVIDADSSQMAAIHSALAGRSFVLQGPPGTGKSQTITNLIAAALGSGKTVLFVAEKMAALDVVHRRLVREGLGDFCLELHSHKANKKEVTASLAAALARTTRVPAPPWQERSAELGAMREQLGAYVEALHRARPLGFTFYAGTARLLGHGERTRVPLGLADPAALEEARWRTFLDQAARFASAAGAVEPIAVHPYRDCRVTEWSERGQQAVHDALHGARAAARARLDAESAARALLAADGVPPAELVGLLSTLGEGPVPEPLADDAAFATLTERTRAFLDAWEQDRARRAELDARWTEGVYALDLPRLSRQFAQWARAFFLFAFLFLFFPRREVRAALRSGAPSSARISDDLKTALAVSTGREALQREQRALAERFTGAWDGAAPEGLRSSLERALRLRATARRLRADGVELPPRTLALAEPTLPTARRAELAAHAERLTGLTAADRSAREVLEAALQTRLPGSTEDALRAIDGFIAALPQFRDWALYGHAGQALESAGLGALARAHREGAFLAADTVVTTEVSVLAPWVAAVRDAEPALRQFVGRDRHATVERFRRSDREHLGLAAKTVIARLEKRLPAAGAGFADSSEPGIILRESRKKTRQKPIRKLLQEVQTLLPRLKPCLLMSPMSVAQYLPASGKRFDLVVFDEASQICTHDAIGALARGDQVVVVGDSRQLPPTSFFTRATEESPDENDFEELESILDEAVAAGLPQDMLGWHYRSRHEALIQFSNTHYYDGRLSVFPAARGRVADLGLSWHPVPGGVYDKGGTRTNRVEAAALVDHLVSTLERTPPGTRTFGVVTFSQAQQTLVSDLLDEARRTHPGIEGHFAGLDESVFVKNLENVQGDERDEILFSVGYGPDANGKVWMNFGPLNRDGGERRLNVAVTRARMKLRVFSTLTHHQIDLSRTAAKGARHLKAFLRYVEEQGGERPARTGPNGDFDSDFERQVHDALVAAGHTVDTQVGCSGYRIDLAVGHPDRPGEYLLGIECDGAPYHSAATARDRDRLREQVLRGLGWRMHRVWSTDWWFDRPRERERLEAAIAEALAAPPPPVEAPPPPVTPEPVRVQQVVVPPSPVEPYRPCELPRVSEDPETIHDPRRSAEVRAAVARVVAQEAPLHVDLLARRVGTAFGATKVTERLRKRILAVAAAVTVRGEVVWPAGVDPAGWTRIRGPAVEGVSRDAGELPVEEIAAAAAWLLSTNLSMPTADLLRETARVFGIQRMGAKVSEAMAAGVDLLVARGRAAKDGERVSWKGP